MSADGSASHRGAIGSLLAELIKLPSHTSRKRSVFFLPTTNVLAEQVGRRMNAILQEAS
jgi:hypothetical protein